MSSGDPATRRNILDAALAQMEESPGEPVAMGAVASRAGVSRQALYLHFADRTELLLEVSREVDAKYRTPARQQRIDRAPTARAALREAVALQAYLKPRLYAMTTALGVLRRTDAAAEAAWQERDQARLERCRALARRLADEGELRPDVSVEAAAALIWSSTSPEAWENLVRVLGWSTARYVRHVTGLLEHGLLRPTGG